MPGELPAAKDLLGQDTALRTMSSALEGRRVAAAYLLHGPEGVGRSLGAQLFGTALLCERPQGIDPCRACRACRWNALGTHPDFLVVSAETGPRFRDDGEAARARLDAFTRAARSAAEPEPRRTIPVRTLRRLLDLLALTPAGGGRKVALIDAFDEVEEEGTATLLKSLEEAPPETTFLLLAGSVDRVPDTILSRSQRVRFQPLAPELVARLLRERGGDAAAGRDEAAVALLVRLAQGSAGRAIRAAELGVHLEGAAAARALLSGRSPEAADAAVAWAAAGRDLAVARERVRAFCALVLLLARDACARGGGAEILDALVPPVRTALEGVEANVTPELVVRGLWLRAQRARSLGA